MPNPLKICTGTANSPLMMKQCFVKFTRKTSNMQVFISQCFVKNTRKTSTRKFSYLHFSREAVLKNDNPFFWMYEAWIFLYRSHVGGEHAYPMYFLGLISCWSAVSCLYQHCMSMHHSPQISQFLRHITSF